MSIPQRLVCDSFDTLTSLDIAILPDVVNPLGDIRGSFNNVSTLTFRLPSPSEILALPLDVTAFVGLLPNLSNLSIYHVWPTQLKQILTHLKPTAPLAKLKLSFWDVASEHVRMDAGDRAIASSDWLPAIRSCVGLPELGQCSRWLVKFTIGHAWNRSSRDIPSFADDGSDDALEWIRFTNDLKGNGIELSSWS